HSRSRRLDRAQHLEPEAGPVFEAAAVGITAPVFERRMELRNEIAVGGVNFDAVEAGRSRPHGGGGGRVDRRLDTCVGHLLGDDRFERRLVDRMRDRRWRDRRLAADVAASVSAAVAELNGRLCSGAMNFIDQVGEPGQKAIVIDADLTASVPAGFLRRRPPGSDEADAASCPRQIISDSVLGDVALLVRGARRHWRHDDAIWNLERADARRSEQDIHGMAQRCGRSMQPRLCMGNFSDNEILGLHKREQQEAIQGVWIYEVAELEGLVKSEVLLLRPMIAQDRRIVELELTGLDDAYSSQRLMTKLISEILPAIEGSGRYVLT